ncbi:MAG: TRAP transporter small permease subunit [Acidimicrobiia bacterium]|nr:TRAP transporter small permease subunit [Acidimicrobiia bacterium]
MVEPAAETAAPGATDHADEGDGSETFENRLFRRLHPIGWAASTFGLAAVVATAVGADLLIGRMPWWLWALTIAVIAASTSSAVLHGVRLAIDVVATFTGRLAMVLAWVIFFLQLFNVITRYSNNWFATDILFAETVSLAWMSFGMLFLLGVNYGVREGINPRIDFWWAEFSNRRKAWLDFIMHSVFFFPFLVLGIRILKPYAAIALGYNRFANGGEGEWPAGWRVWETWVTSVNAGELPAGPIRAFIFVAFILWAAQVFGEMIKTGFIIAGREDLADLHTIDAPMRVE